MAATPTMTTDNNSSTLLGYQFEVLKEIIERCEDNWLHKDERRFIQRAPKPLNRILKLYYALGVSFSRLKPSTGLIHKHNFRVLRIPFIRVVDGETKKGFVLFGLSLQDSLRFHYSVHMLHEGEVKGEIIHLQELAQNEFFYAVLMLARYSIAGMIDATLGDTENSSISPLLNTLYISRDYALPKPALYDGPLTNEYEDVLAFIEFCVQTRSSDAVRLNITSDDMSHVELMTREDHVRRILESNNDIKIPYHYITSIVREYEELSLEELKDFTDRRSIRV